MGTKTGRTEQRALRIPIAEVERAERNAERLDALARAKGVPFYQRERTLSSTLIEEISSGGAALSALCDAAGIPFDPKAARKR